MNGKPEDTRNLSSLLELLDEWLRKVFIERKQMTSQNSPSHKPWNNIRTLEEYGEAAMSSAVYKSDVRLLSEKGTIIALYPFIKLGGEIGEVLDKLGKIIRDSDGVLSIKQQEALMHELGDVLWYTNACAHELGYSLGTVARRNIGKLAGRVARNTIQGSGDER